MAPLPTIPTSFVPRAISAPRRNANSDIGSVFGYVAYPILAIVFAMALGVFFYGRLLGAEKISKDTQLAKAEAAIDPATITGFVQLQNRLNSGQILLANHIALSGFFSVLESILPTTVRFTSLHVAIDPTGIAKVEGSGVSKSFNALAVASDAFATDSRIKDAIFSKMNINKDSSVSFAFSATLDPKLIAFSPGGIASSSTVSTKP